MRYVHIIALILILPFAMIEVVARELIRTYSNMEIKYAIIRGYEDWLEFFRTVKKRGTGNE